MQLSHATTHTQLSHLNASLWGDLCSYFAGGRNCRKYVCLDSFSCFIQTSFAIESCSAHNFLNPERKYVVNSSKR